MWMLMGRSSDECMYQEHLCIRHGECVAKGASIIQNLPGTTTFNHRNSTPTWDRTKPWSDVPRDYHLTNGTVKLYSLAVSQDLFVTDV